MKHEIGLIQKSDKNYRVQRPTQSGFSSPATHYSEPKIDLNEVLANNSISTFFIRVADDSFKDHNINKDDVLIVDKSITPKNNQLVFYTKDGGFSVAKIDLKSKAPLEVWGTITFIIKSTLL